MSGLHAARPAAGAPVIEMTQVSKTYGSGEAAVHALDGVDLVIERGDYVAIMGASGSGKSTLMNIVGCLDAPRRVATRSTASTYAASSEQQLSLIRNRKIGFVFQSFNLIPRTSAQPTSSCRWPMRVSRSPSDASGRPAALDRVGLADRVHHQPSELSGGQQQRVAVARAIVTEPVLLLADEPTGALDSHSTAEVLTLFDELAAGGRTVVMITHEDDVARHAKRILRFSDGRIVSDERQVALDAPPPRWAGVPA